jgi:hypothetical protein
MSDHGRFAFEPLLNLLNGRPVGLEVLRCQARDQVEYVARNSVWGTRQLAEFDSGIAIASVLHGTDYDASVPLHVDVLADTVVTARRRIGQLRGSLLSRDGNHPAPPILLEINPALSAAPADALAEGVAELRSASGSAWTGQPAASASSWWPTWRPTSSSSIATWSPGCPTSRSRARWRMRWSRCAARWGCGSPQRA